jgi:preprotein translocase subunit YajC
MDNFWILGQAEPSGITSEQTNDDTEVGTEATTKQPSDANNVQGQRKERPGLFESPQLLFLGLMFVLMYFVLFRGPKKKQQQHKQMVQALERNDRVRTIGGIIGTVVDVKGDEITLKIDESNNTKIKVISSAIGKNLTKEEA